MAGLGPASDHSGQTGPRDIMLFRLLLWIVCVGRVISDWASVLEDVRTEQAALWKSAENWVATTQGYNAQWSGELGSLKQTCTDAVVESKGHVDTVKKTIANKCPAKCQTDPMTLINWQGSQDYAHLNAQKTQYARETADFEAELHEVETLLERFEPFSKKTNLLHFKAKEEFEKFEDNLSDLEEQTKAALLLRLRSSLKKNVAGKKQKSTPGTGSKPDFETIKTKEIGRIKMMKAACDAMETTYKEMKTVREKIKSRKSGEVARYENTIKKMKEKTKKATEDSNKFADVYGGFQSICQDESNKYVDRASSMGDLEPPELKDKFVAELDRHHMWWKTYCEDMGSVAEMVQGWIASCKTAWRDSTMGAEERILDQKGMVNPANADDFKKATEGMCKTQAEFDNDLADTEKKMQDLSAALP